MVTATFRCSAPGSSTRISIGSSVARRSRRCLRVPASMVMTPVRVVLVGRSMTAPSPSVGSASAGSLLGMAEG